MKLPALVKALAEVDEREEATLNHVARLIREAGHLPTTKRGPGSANMGPREMANLLIAANGTDLPRNAPNAVTQFRSLSVREWAGTLCGSDYLAGLAEAPTFGEALDLLIAGTRDFPSATLYEAARARHPEEKNVGLGRRVMFSRPKPEGVIQFVTMAYEDDCQTLRFPPQLIFECRFSRDPATPLLEPFTAEPADRIVTVTIKERTLAIMGVTNIKTFSTADGDIEVIFDDEPSPKHVRQLRAALACTTLSQVDQVLAAFFETIKTTQTKQSQSNG